MPNLAIQPKKSNQAIPTRADGTPKGKGYLGVLRRPDGGYSTEISIGVEFDGRAMEIPSMVPTLDRSEVDYLLRTRLSPSMWKTEVGKGIMDKATEHAKERMSKGLSPFYD